MIIKANNNLIKAINQIPIAKQKEIIMDIIKSSIKHLKG